MQLLPPDMAADDVFRIDVEPLDEAGVERMLRAASGAGTPIGRAESDEEDFRISIAGAQEKTALLRHRGKWQVPIGATPSTHIFKLPLGRIGNSLEISPSSVQNEWLCSKLMAAYGVPIADCEMAEFDNGPVLIVERFDRKLSSDKRWWIRLPQEDFCQALAVPSGMKYESDEGPGIPEIMSVLRGSVEADRDRDRFLRTQILFWMLAATDGHAKNFSLFIEAQGKYRATPLYDVISFWPYIGKGRGKLSRKNIKMAMAVHGKGKHYNIDTIRRRHWTSTARKCAYGVDVESMIDKLVELTPGVIERVAADLPATFPAFVAESIFEGLRESAGRLEMQRGEAE